MINLARSLSVAAAGALLLTTTVASAQATRPGSSVPTVSKAVTAKMGERSSKRVKAEERLVGAPVFLIGIFGVAIAVAVVAVASGSNDSRG